MKTLLKKLSHGLTALVSLAIVVVPLIAGDAQVRHLAHNELVRHPGVAAYVPAALVVVHALSKVLRARRVAKAPPPL